MRNPCQCEFELSQAIALVRMLWCTYIDVEPEQFSNSTYDTDVFRLTFSLPDHLGCWCSFHLRISRGHVRLTVPVHLWEHRSTWECVESLQFNRSSHDVRERVGSTQRRTVLLKTFGGHSFGYITPTVWNSLPADQRASASLQTFQAKLNTHIN